MTLEFTQLPLCAPLLRAAADAGYRTPTPVQAQAVPAALQGQDLCVCAQTGSGKTAAFLLPSLHRIAEKRSSRPGKGPRILVLTPTRELAQQVEENARIYGKYLKWLRTAVLVGGTSYGMQTRALAKPVDLVIATPGRLIDHLQQNRIDFARLEVLILDEADRMLDMGFIEDIKKIVSAMDSERQTLLFSATLDDAVGKFAEKLTRNPQRIETARAETQGKIREELYYCDDIRHKMRLLDYFLRDTAVDQAVVFTATKAMSEELADTLEEKGYTAACLNGDMPQNWRNRTLRQMHRGMVKILVATDVAARGIDVARISHVFNFDLPKQAEDYVHRIGRTGRAGREGTAVTFADVREYPKIHQLERYLKRKLPECEIAGMEATRKKRKPAKPAGKGRGKPFAKNAGRKNTGNAARRDKTFAPKKPARKNFKKS